MLVGRETRIRERLETWSRKKQTARNAETCTGQKGKPPGVELKKPVIITVIWRNPKAKAIGDVSGNLFDKDGFPLCF